MSKPKSISEVINSGKEHKRLLAVADKSRKWTRKSHPPPIGRFVALIIFGELFFVDMVDVCDSHTAVWDGNSISVLPFCPQESTLERGILKIIYTNQIEIKLFRIS